MGTARGSGATGAIPAFQAGAFAVMWGPSDVQFFPESDWKRQLDTMTAIRNSKVAMLSHTRLWQVPGMDTGTDNWGRPVTYWQTLWYSLGSFLLGKNGNAYFMFHDSGGGRTSEPHLHRDVGQLDWRARAPDRGRSRMAGWSARGRGRYV